MRRRVVLEGLTAGLTVSIAGCAADAAPSGPRNPPGADEARSTDPTDDGGRDPGLHILNFDFFEGDDGGLVVEVQIANDASRQDSGTVVAVARTPDRTVEATESVTLDADAERELTIELDMEYEAFAANGTLSVEIER